MVIRVHGLSHEQQTTIQRKGRSDRKERPSCRSGQTRHRGPDATNFVTVDEGAGRYAFRAECVVEDDMLTNGELACRVTEEGVLYQEDNFLSVSTLCGNAMVFAPKYRRKVFCGEKRAEVGAILRHLVKYFFADTTLQLHKPYVQKILCDAICESYNSFSPWNSVQLPSIFGSASPTCRSRRRHYKR